MEIDDDELWVTPWKDMTKEMKRAAYDELLQSCRETADGMEKELNDYLATKTTMRVKVEIQLVPSVNDDPRL